ncbi:hypothetical protein Mapa_011471 [Marchantia paleacea]|nr:hypothetical protein Mapa_011471 [Marchantia paleacea]
MLHTIGAMTQSEQSLAILGGHLRSLPDCMYELFLNFRIKPTLRTRIKRIFSTFVCTHRIQHGQRIRHKEQVPGLNMLCQEQSTTLISACCFHLNRTDIVCTCRNFTSEPTLEIEISQLINTQSALVVTNSTQFYGSKKIFIERCTRIGRFQMRQCLLIISETKKSTTFSEKAL